MKTVKIIPLLLYSFFICNSYPQVLNQFGIKGGMILSRLTYDNNLHSGFIIEPVSKYACLKTDFGLYAEMFDSRNFCTSVELHYLNKGEDSKNPIQVYYPDTSNNYLNTDFKYISDRFQHISFQILQKWKFIIRSDDKMFIFGGPVLNLRISNHSEVSENALELKNSKLLFGFKAGYGIELWDVFLLELSFSHDFTNSYVITDGDNSLNRQHDSFELLAGFNLKKLLRINL
jgi:hypothetical protein